MYLYFSWLSLLHMGCYILFILFSKSFLDAYIPLDNRIFMPVLICFYLLLAAALGRLLLLGDRAGKLSAGTALMFLLVSNTAVLLPVVRVYGTDGTGYLSAYMANISRIDEVSMLEGKTLYSNGPDFIRLTIAAPALDYPRKYSPTTTRPNANFQAELDEMLAAVSAQDAYLVHYGIFESRNYFLSGAELATAGFTEIMTGSGVVILGHLPEAGQNNTVTP